MASQDKNPKADRVLDLQAVDIKTIMSLPEDDGKEKLAEKLGLSPYLDAKDPQKAPFISYLFDNIKFATEKGFPWPHICLVVKFAHEFLKKILGNGHRLADTITDFQEMSGIIAPLSDRHLKQYTDFIHQTVLCHYNLYKYVFSHLRERITPKITRDIEVPPTIPPLNIGRDVVIWDYQNKVKDVEAKEKESAEASNLRLQGVRQEKTDAHKTLEDLADEPTPYSKMTLTELVQDVLKGYTERKEAELSMIADATAEGLQYKFEKTNIPRPAALGPPRRFRPRSPVEKQSTNMSNSNIKTKNNPQSARVKSGRASKGSATSKK